MKGNDSWTAGDAYEFYMGRWSRLIAEKFVDWLGEAPGGSWLDVGCGTGALTRAILKRVAPAQVTGVDPSEGFVAAAREQVRDARARFQVAGVTDLPFPTNTFSAVVSGLALNFMPAHLEALATMARVAQPGGTVAVYIWDYSGQMQMLRVFWDAAVRLDPASAEEDEGLRFPICRPEPLGELFEDAGLKQVKVDAIDVVTRFRDFDDYWLPFLGGTGPAPAYVRRLDEERRTALRERIRSRLPVATDGSISLVARAWGARGTG